VLPKKKVPCHLNKFNVDWPCLYGNFCLENVDLRENQSHDPGNKKVCAIKVKSLGTQSFCDPSHTGLFFSFPLCVSKGVGKRGPLIHSSTHWWKNKLYSHYEEQFISLEKCKMHKAYGWPSCTISQYLTNTNTCPHAKDICKDICRSEALVIMMKN
jgi:hypothetical protein